MIIITSVTYRYVFIYLTIALKHTIPKKECLKNVSEKNYKQFLCLKTLFRIEKRNANDVIQKLFQI